MNTELTFAVTRWSAWIPRDQEQASLYQSDGRSVRESSVETPDLGFIPAMQRRRLGKLARVVIHTLHHCAGNDNHSPAIFASVMGEIGRTQSILEAISEEQPVSPAAFSLAVHNGIAGQWSMITGNKASMLALGDLSGSPVPALLEAIGILQEGRHNEVDIVLYEEPLPVFYEQFRSGPSGNIAIALRLTNVRKTGPDSSFAHMRLCQRDSEVQTGNAICRLTELLAGVRALATFSDEQSTWTLEMAR